MFKKIAIAALLFLGVSTPAKPFWHGSAGASGSVQLNVGNGDIVPSSFLNVLPTGTKSFSSGATPGTAALDSNGIPTQSFTGLMSVTFDLTRIFVGVSYTLSWTAGTKLPLFNGGNNSGCVLSGAGGSVSGCSGGNVTITIDGTGAGSLTWLPANGFSLQFPGSGTYGAAGTAKLDLRRTSDVGRPGYITPEFAADLVGLKTIRTMGWDQNASDNNETLLAYRPTPNSLTWKNQFPLGAWSGGANSAGTVSGTDQYTAAAAPDTSLAGWVAGEVIQGAFTNGQSALITISSVANNGSGLCRLTVNSTAAIITGQQIWVSTVIDNASGEPFTPCSESIFTATVINGTTLDLQGTTFSGTAKTNTGWVGIQTLAITGKSGGAKFIAGLTGYPISTLGAGISTCIYDDFLDRVLCNAGGIISAVPIEVSVSIANQVNANLWATIGPHVTDGYVTAWATAALALNSSLYFYPEYSNEVWNFGFNQTPWSRWRGYKLGFPFGSNEATYGWYGLRVRQIMGNLIAPVWAGRTSQLRRVNAFFAVPDTGTSTYRFAGADLAPAGVSTGKGNALYCTYTGGTFSGTCSGGADYTSVGNRPIDKTEVVANAAYAGGANLFFGPDNASGGTPTAANTVFYQSLVNAWDGGSTAAAIALVDDDIQQGRFSVQNVTASGTTFTTPAAHGFANGNWIAFQVTGGTSYSGLVAGAIYNVTSTSSAGCPGAVVCNFTVQGFVNGFATGSNINAGTAGSGTATVGSTGNHLTMQVSATWVQLFAQNLGATYSKRVEWYEAALEPVGPSAAQATALGLTGTNPSASIGAAITAWRNDPTSAATVQTYYKNFMGTNSNMVPTFGVMTASKTPSWLVLPGPADAINPASNPWGLLSGLLPNSTPYQTYNGFKAFSSGVN